MLAQNTCWSSGELSGTPSMVTLMRESPAPRMRRKEVPVPTPLSPQAITPGVLLSRKGSSCPLCANSRSSDFLMLATAKGAFFCTLTPCTTTSSICWSLSVDTESPSATKAFAAAHAGSSITVSSKFFIVSFIIIGI